MNPEDGEREFPKKFKWKNNIQLQKKIIEKRSLIDLNLFFSNRFSSGSISKCFLPPNRVVSPTYRTVSYYLCFSLPLWPSKESTFKQVIIIIHLRLAFPILHAPSRNNPFRHFVPFHCASYHLYGDLFYHSTTSNSNSLFHTPYRIHLSDFRP